MQKNPAVTYSANFKLPPAGNSVLTFNQQTFVKIREIIATLSDCIKQNTLTRSSRVLLLKYFTTKSLIRIIVIFHALLTLKLQVEACNIKSIHTQLDNDHLGTITQPG